VIAITKHESCGESRFDIYQMIPVITFIEAIAHLLFVAFQRYFVFDLPSYYTRRYKPVKVKAKSYNEFVRNSN